MTDTVVVEGHVKFRDGKKWKSRWVILRKPSPVADCLSLLVYKEKKKGKEKVSLHKERLSVTLEGICGVEPGLGYDGVSYSLSIICLARTLVLGFNSRDTLLSWDARVRYSLGEVHRFSVNVEPGTKLESGLASLHLCNDLLVLTRGVPPVVIGHWKLSALRRYGAVTHGFVFEGGTRCGCWAGVFILSCSEGEQISFLFDCIVRGITPSRTPHGLQPALPDPNADPVSAEERISQEASELEKRLSMLSQCSLASSTASSYSSATSVAGDDQSSISSSSSNQSDVSYGSRLPSWVEPSARSHISSETASSSSTLKALTSSNDRLYAAVMGGTGATSSSAHLHPRGLSDSGRQSSLDSGIGIATGSQSSYSGSVSSCTESLDSQGAGEEFGSMASLPAPSSLHPSVPSSTPLPPPPPLQSTLLFSPHIHEYSPATSATSPCASRSSSCASLRHSEEYQTHGLMRPRYDTPRSLLQSLPKWEPPSRGGLPELDRDSRSSGDGGGSRGQRSSNGSKLTLAQCRPMMQCSHSWGSERAPSGDAERRSTPMPGGLVCGETQFSSSASGLPPSVDTRDPPLCVREEHDDELAGLQKMTTSLPTSAAPPFSALSTCRTASHCGAFQALRPPVSLDSERHRDVTANYVNIAISTLTAKTNGELCTELHMQEPGSATGSSPFRVLRGSTRYAHLAMEPAESVGAERVRGREDTLTQMGDRRRGPQQ